MKSRSKNQRRKTYRNNDSYPDSFLDEEQIATQILFNISDFNDHTNYQKDFNGLFDMFRSVDLNQKSSNHAKNEQKNLHLNKFSSTVQEGKKFREKCLEKNKIKFQESKFLIKLYEGHTEQDFSRSPTLRIRKQKIFEKISNDNPITLTFKALQSDSVFVGKNLNDKSIIKTDEKNKQLQRFLNLKNNQNSIIFQKSEKLPAPKILADLTFQNPKRKPQSTYQHTFENVKTLSPQTKNQSILLQCAQIKRLESLYSVRPLSKTTLGPCSQLRKKGEQKLSPRSMRKSNEKELGKTLRLNRLKELSPTRYNETKRKKVFF